MRKLRRFTDWKKAAYEKRAFKNARLPKPASPDPARKYVDPLPWCLSMITIHQDFFAPTDPLEKKVLTRTPTGRMKRLQAQYERHGLTGLPHHFYLGTDGELFEGCPIDHIGQHSPGRDTSNIGVCLFGEFSKRGIPPKQYRALIELLCGLCSEYDINPSAIYSMLDMPAFVGPQSRDKPKYLGRSLPAIRKSIVGMLTSDSEEIEQPHNVPHFAEVNRSEMFQIKVISHDNRTKIKVGPGVPVDTWIDVDLSLSLTGPEQL